MANSKEEWGSPVVNFVNQHVPHEFSWLGILKFLANLVASVWNYPIIKVENYHIVVSNIVISLVVIMVGLRVVRRMTRAFKYTLVRKTSLDATSREALCLMVHYFLVLLVIVLALDIANIPTKIFTFVGGALALSLGFGTRVMVGNFLNGIVMMLGRPVRIGDMLEVNGSLAKVVATGTVQTKLLTEENVEWLVPNSNLNEDILRNYSSAEGGVIMMRIPITFERDRPFQEIESIVMQVVNANPYVLLEKPNKVLLTSLEGNVYHLETQVWINIKTGVGRKAVASMINIALEELLHTHQIKLAEPRKRIVPEEV